MRPSLVAGALAVLLIAPAAVAAPSSQDRALAESLFREAKALAKGGDYDEACPKFAESQRIDPQLGTLLYLATCHEQQGRTATAWAEYSEALELAEEAGDRKRRKLAKRRVKALEAKLSHLVVTAGSPPEGLEVVLDERSLSAASLGTRLPMDPGEHRLEARAPRHEPWSREVEVPEGPGEVSISIPALEPLPDAIDEGVDGATSDADAGSSQRLAGWIVGGVGVVGFGLMAGFGAAAASQSSSADDECDGNFCTQEGLDGHDRARTSATVSTVGLVVGLLGVGGGLTLLLTAPSAEEPSEAWLRPAVGPGLAALEMGVRW